MEIIPGAIHEAASAAAPRNSACSMGRVFRPRGSLSSRVTCLRWSTISSQILLALDYRWASSSSQAKGERVSLRSESVKRRGNERRLLEVRSNRLEQTVSQMARLSSSLTPLIFTPKA